MEYIIFDIIKAIFIGFSFGVFLFLWDKHKEKKDLKFKKSFLEEKIEEIQTEYDNKTTMLQIAEKMLSQAEKDLQEVQNDINVSVERRRAAEEAAELELSLERERRRAAFEKSLEFEFQELKVNSDVESLRKELEALNSEISSNKERLKIQQDIFKAELEKEDFDKFHSISLTSRDKKDIELILELGSTISRKEALRKLVWTEFIQKPIQLLCKALNAEKVGGIYKITNKANGRMYIGQAVDIAARWKEHCKAGLGIGTSSYLSNKFYKALYEEGIDNFTFEILEEVPLHDLSKRERYWIDYFNAVDFGYNTKIGG